MKSTDMWKEIQARTERIVAEKPDAQREWQDRYWVDVRGVSDACLNHCRVVKGLGPEPVDTEPTFFSAIPSDRAWHSGEIDERIGSLNMSIWETENERCCDMDFGDEGPLWIFLRRINDDLVAMIRYTEETYGVFDLPDDILPPWED